MRIGGLRGALLAATALLPQPAVHAAPVDPAFWTVAVGDLDGDGVGDLAEPQSGIVFDPSLTGVTARSGASGEPLWQVRLPLVTRILPVRTGPGDEPGLVAVADGIHHAGVAMVDRTGEVLWYRTWPAATDITVTTGGFLPGGGDDLMVARYDGAGSTKSTRVAEIVNGGTGATAAVLGPELIGARYTDPVPLGDLDGDGATDLAWTVPSATDTGGSAVRAISGDDGRTLWENGTLDQSGIDPPTPVGDMTGDGRPDLVVTTGGWSTSTLFSGADGTVAWTRPGQRALAVQDISGDRLPDVVLLDGDESGVTARAYDRFGRTVYRSRLPYNWFEPAGDLTRDGVTDFRATWWREDHHRTPEGLIDGRSGRVLRTHPTETEIPLGRSVDCRGADTLTGTYGKTSGVVRALDGRNGRTLWSVRIPVEPGGVPDAAFTVLARSRSRCADVLVSAAGYTALVEPSGRIRWELGEPPA